MIGTGRALSRYLPAAALFVALIVAWQLAVTVLRVREYLLPAPLTVARAMVGDEIPWLRHLGITSLEFRRRFPFPAALARFLELMIVPYRGVWPVFHPLETGSWDSGHCLAVQAPPPH